MRGAGGAGESFIHDAGCRAELPAPLVPGGWRWLFQADLQPHAWAGLYTRLWGGHPGACVHLHLFRTKSPGKKRECIRSDMVTEGRSQVKVTEGARSAQQEPTSASGVSE